MSASHRRHDISDPVWNRLKPHLLGEQGKVGETCLQITEIGRTPTAGFAVGETGVSGKSYWKK